jgi:BirA family biotin operon repressor/biotin-[acetyl-CoA-carboxylase] ligase
MRSFFSIPVRRKASPAVCQAGGVLVDDATRHKLAGTRFAQVVELEETTSTNSVLAGLARQGAREGLVVVAGHQTAGRGRFDRRWESPPGQSLLLSVLLRPAASELPPERRHLVVAAVALALAEACQEVAGAGPDLKWPNDLVHEGRKLAGILAEEAGAGAVVVGLGLNVAWAPEGLGATCLRDITGRQVNRDELLVAFLLALDRLYGHWEEVSCLYRQRCSTIGKLVRVERGRQLDVLQGTAVAINDNGHLLVRPDGSFEIVEVAAGDVVHATPAL